MTGGGRGFCVLRVPGDPGEPLVGAAGRAGRPVGAMEDGKDELEHLRGQARQIEATLRTIHARI